MSRSINGFFLNFYCNPNPQLFLKKNFLLLIIICFSLLGKSQVNTDQKDLGYSGPVKQIITKFFSEISLHKEKWNVNDSLHPGIVLIEYFNKQGNFTRKEVRTAFDTSIMEYNYSNKENPSWIKKNNSGDITETATISQESPNIIKEVITDATDSNSTEMIRHLDIHYRTKTLEEKGYDSKGKLIYHTISTNEDDNQGRFWKVRTEDKLKKTIDIFEFQLLKKDKFGNSTEIITKKNDKVIGIRLVTILYYPE